MTAVPALSAAAVPTATASGSGAADEGATTTSFAEALRAESPAPATPADGPATASSQGPAEAASTPEDQPAGRSSQKPILASAPWRPASATLKATDTLPGDALPAAPPALAAAAANEAQPLHETAVANDAAASVLAPPEAFLQWLENLKEFSKPLAASPTTPLTASESLSTASAGLQGSSCAAVTQQMIDVLAAGSTSEPAVVSTGAAVSPTVLPALSAAPALVSSSSPPAPAAAPLPLAMDQGDWPQQLGEQIQWRLGVGIQEARIEISPRELGAIDVRLSVDDRGLSVQLSAAQTQTREMLQAELPRLREALQQGGLQLADAQVGREAPGRQGEREAAPSQTRSAVQDGSKEEGEGLTTSAGVWRARRGLLDDYA